MNGDFQDRIDDYLLGRMSDEEKIQFEKEVGEDKSKREQLDFTQNVKSAISSREDKLKRLDMMKGMYDDEHRYNSRASGTDGIMHCSSSPRMTDRMKFEKKPSRRIWLWASGIAAVFVIGLLIIKPFNTSKLPYDEVIRGEENEIFDNVSPDKNYEKGFGCSRKKDEINERIREIDKNSIVDTTALDTVVTFGLK